ncbi:DMP19 family protein [Sphingomonas xinjiangensis]|uniref:DNA mimic protein DMP19 C-terminal domain-containing protein n=1 Tax=Sphingomonas xinjiangensis TaxID=643568 RepID=A0A840YU13_9SPHN|nr:DUF4375 domain-containing protein [Sphingomonas xinjiangensis]MBB5713103.1 hypothetical protein [Sphingomonas xinjiangensis]
MIGSIQVAKADMVAQEPWQLCLQVGYAIERLKERGCEAELSLDALHFANLWEYLGEITNGGHAQYHENEEDCTRHLEGMSELLLRIGLPGHADLLNKFGRVVVENEDHILDLWASGDHMAAKELFYNLDDHFAELERREGKLQDHLRNWLAQQPWIVTEEDQR